MTPTTPLTLLTDPFLQFPTETSVKIVWFTEFPGTDHQIIYGENLDNFVLAKTTKLSRTREDQGSKTRLNYSQVTEREIWRHEGEITGLIPGKKIPYQVSSKAQNQSDPKTIKSKIFSLRSSQNLAHL